MKTALWTPCPSSCLGDLMTDLEEDLGLPNFSDCGNQLPAGFCPIPARILRGRPAGVWSTQLIYYDVVDKSS